MQASGASAEVVAGQGVQPVAELSSQALQKALSEEERRKLRDQRYVMLLPAAVLCCAVLCCAVLCCAVLCCAVLCCAVLCHDLLCCAAVCLLCCAIPPY